MKPGVADVENAAAVPVDVEIFDGQPVVGRPEQTIRTSREDLGTDERNVEVGQQAEAGRLADPERLVRDDRQGEVDPLLDLRRPEEVQIRVVSGEGEPVGAVRNGIVTDRDRLSCCNGRNEDGRLRDALDRYDRGARKPDLRPDR